MRFEVGGLCELLVAAIKWTDVGTVACVDSYMRPQVEVQREALATSFKCTLKNKHSISLESELELGSIQYILFSIGFVSIPIYHNKQITK